MTTRAATANDTISPSKTLHIALWVVQGLLATAFLMAGGMKLTAPVDQLAVNLKWVTGALGPFVRFIGAAEVAGALGLILPAAFRIKPKLTTLAALGLTIDMMGAVATHVVRGEWMIIAAPAMLGALAAFVVWGRTKKVPFQA
jgi:hypothetical protein